jgi:hypothetical protein
MKNTIVKLDWLHLIVTKHDGMSENVIINDISAGNNNKAYAE